MISTKSPFSFSSLLLLSKSSTSTSKGNVAQVIKKNQIKSSYIANKDKASSDSSTKKPAFLPSDVFKGPRPDYHFKKGSYGVGYYYSTDESTKQINNVKVTKTMKVNDVSKQLPANHMYESIQSR